MDFLIHLHRDKGFPLSALKGYRSAINSVLALNGTDLAESRELSMLFRSFAKSCPTTGPCPPAWDVALVLNSLTAAPYEPLKDAEERLLAHKTLFLLALTSAKRVGELHALSHRVSHSVGWREVSFSFVPGFVAKTQDQSSLGQKWRKHWEEAPQPIARATLGLRTPSDLQQTNSVSPLVVSVPPKD